MSDLATTEALFFSESGLTKESAQRHTEAALKGMEDGELFLEYVQAEALGFDDGVLKQASFTTDSGFGLRSVLGETTGYAHSSELSETSLKRATQTVQAIRAGHSGKITIAPAPVRTNTHLYSEMNPLQELEFAAKVSLLKEIDAYLRAKDPQVRQVSASLAASWQAVLILRAGGEALSDIRPLVRMNVSVVVEKDGRMERGSFGCGGRKAYGEFIAETSWRAAADEALRQARVNLEAIAAPAGEMTVVLGAGWPGILLHEAIGHGLEGDFNRKGTSAFSGLLGQQVASKEVTVLDDGTLPDRRGSLTIDDEGTPAQRTVLIEDGILKAYMQDRQNARLMGMKPTGNGRREGFSYQPMPRMTNTYMLPGNFPKEEIIASVKKGLYAPNFGGGQVDITSGKFVFSASEAYLIENGKITTPVKGATLIGNGPDVLTKVEMVGNDMQLDPGVGTCGKAGQGVPVGVGQPTLKIGGLTVGGTAA